MIRRDPAPARNHRERNNRLTLSPMVGGGVMARWFNILRMALVVGVMALTARPGASPAQNLDKAAKPPANAKASQIPPLDYENPETTIKTPKDGDIIGMTIPIGGELYITTRPGLRFSITKAKLSPNLTVKGSQNNITLLHTNDQPATASLDITLEDGRKISARIRSQKTKKTAGYVIID